MIYWLNQKKILFFWVTWHLLQSFLGTAYPTPPTPPIASPQSNYHWLFCISSYLPFRSFNPSSRQDSRHFAYQPVKGSVIIDRWLLPSNFPTLISQMYLLTSCFGLLWMLNVPYICICRHFRWYLPLTMNTKTTITTTKTTSPIHCLTPSITSGFCQNFR